VSGTIITSCSQYLNEDAINLQSVIMDHITNTANKNVRFDSVYGMVSLVLALCIRNTIEYEFGDMTVGDTKERFLETFAAAIARAVSDKTA
jgi:hypothetical protein